jgi:hypothetical protein
MSDGGYCDSLKLSAAGFSNEEDRDAQLCLSYLVSYASYLGGDREGDLRRRGGDRERERGLRLECSRSAKLCFIEISSSIPRRFMYYLMLRKTVDAVSSLVNVTNAYTFPEFLGILICVIHSAYFPKCARISSSVECRFRRLMMS